MFLKGDEPWFVAIDVCKLLGIRNNRDAMAKLEADDVGSTDVIDAIGRPQNTTLVTESGLYALIFLSRKPEALAFQRWVTKEVLPQIRKYGFYSARQSPSGRFLGLIDALKATGIYPHGAAKIALEFGVQCEREGIDEAECLLTLEDLCAKGLDWTYAKKVHGTFHKRLENRRIQRENFLLTHPGSDISALEYLPKPYDIWAG